MASSVPSGLALTGSFLGLLAEPVAVSRNAGSAARARDAPLRWLPPLDACVLLPAGTYRVGEEEDERTVSLPDLWIGRWPVTNALVARFARSTGRALGALLAARLADPQLADHPATEITFAEALAFCAWASDGLDRPVRLPSGTEWEAAARGQDGRAWPWGGTFDADRCACVEAAWGTTVPVTAHPQGSSAIGAEQLAGNVWEWVADTTEAGAWRAVRGGCYLDHAWGVRAARSLPADPLRATTTTGFRIAIDTGRAR